MRIYTSNGALDFCKECMPSEEEAIELYGFDISYDDVHPDYTEDPYCTYECEKCYKKLTNRDQ